MKYCINCGAELIEGAGFCGRCGIPVGQVIKQGHENKKGVIIGISLGGMILVVVLVGILFAKNLAGNKGKTVRTGTNATSVENVPEALAEPTFEGGESSENDERSMESKDMTTLDNVASALATAVANAGANAGSGIIDDVAAIGAGSNEVEKGIVESLGDVSGIKMVSAAGKGHPVQCKWDMNTSEIKVWAGGDSDDGAMCQYYKDQYGNLARLIVEK